MVFPRGVRSVLVLFTLTLGTLASGCGGDSGGSEDAGRERDASADQAGLDGATDQGGDNDQGNDNDQGQSDASTDAAVADADLDQAVSDDQSTGDLGSLDGGNGDLGSADGGIFTLLDTSLSAVEDEPRAGTLDFAGPEELATACTFAVTTPPAHGTLGLDPPLGITYSPAANYHGSDSAVVTATCGARNTSATVSIAVLSINDAPSLRLVGNASVSPPLSRPFSSNVTETVCMSLAQGLGSVDLGFELVDAEPAAAGENDAYVVQVTAPDSPSCLVHFPTESAWAVSDAGYTFVGPLAAVQAELAGLFVECASATPVATAISVVVSDAGNAGACSPTVLTSCPKTASAVVNVQARATPGSVDPYAGACPL